MLKSSDESRRFSGDFFEKPNQLSESNARPDGSMGVIFTRIEQNDELTLEGRINELREQGECPSRC